MKPNPVLIVGIGMIALACGLMLFGKPTTGGTVKDAPGGELGQEVLEQCESGDSACYIDSLKNLVKEESPAAALEALHVVMAGDASVHTLSHPFAHAIGHATYAKYPKLSDALVSCRDDFASGCYHGVMEMKIGRGGAPKPDEISTACSDSRIRETLFLLHQCSHGLGHGLMMSHLLTSRTAGSGELTASLADCDFISDGWERRSCYSGVFMEFVNAALFPSFHYANKPALKADDMQYPCNAIPAAYSADCYIMQATVMLYHAQWDFIKTFEACQQAISSGSDMCYQSLGREISGQALQSADLIRTNCEAGQAVGQRAVDQCFLGAAKDVVYISANPSHGFALCDSIGPLNQPTCFYGVGEMIHGLKASGEERRDACAAAGRGRTDCLRGARVAEQ